MNSRILRINLGDWSNDGHRESETYIIKISGQNVSDTAIVSSYNAVKQASDVDLATICQDWEDGSMSPEEFDSLKQIGFNPTIYENGYNWKSEGILISDDKDLFIDAVELVMFYTGYEIKDFTWKLLDYPVLIGGPKTILPENSFGYGLF